MKRVCARLSADWEEHYDHLVLVLETFVDPSRFSGTVYTVSNWKELGLTRGNARKGRDYYEAHGQPKRLFVRELVRGACRSLQAETLKPSLAQVDEKAPLRCTQSSQELGSLKERFKKQVPEYHKQRCTYPVYGLTLDHRGRASCWRPARAEGFGSFREQPLAVSAPRLRHTA